MADDDKLDDADLDLIAALQHAPRAPFDMLARVLGSSARTVGRRYGRLLDEGLLRVICEVDWSLLAEGPPVHLWIDTEPGRAREVAAALADRADTAHVGITSGHGDVYAVLQGMTRAATSRALVDDIPGTPGIRGVRAHWSLRRLTSSAAWRLPRLTADQEAALAAHTAAEEGNDPNLGPLERQVAAVLRDNARAPYSDLARALDVSESRARRTATAMFASGLLRPRVEVEPRHLGYQVEAVLEISCPPSAATRLSTALAAHPATRFLALIGAAGTFVCDGVFRDEGDLADFIMAGAAADVEVTAVACTLQLEVVKRYWRRTQHPERPPGQGRRPAPGSLPAG
ncbi:MULTISPECIES: Lrp/AsnC family transcriptional regulator [Streptomyces]|uniref:Lrp/AsnC family transcriptional regulator n=1 Tax=Streptomyces TaxID=1883 RepID=UPI00099F90EC|nr:MULTISPECIES: Lrp/AsnC family transcriptional regulator [unclassified Streptomyces]MCO8303430.1 Lrp/AsnC family transcriptional regulator [Streptomyces sp. RKCA744]